MKLRGATVRNGAPEEREEPAVVTNRRKNKKTNL